MTDRDIADRHIADPDIADRDIAEAGYRVSVRELRETTWRALLANGVSSGEAMVAAEAVTFAEIHLAAGLDAVEAELAHSPTTAERPAKSSCTLSVGERYDTIEDPADRGLLLLAPLAIGLVAATSRSSPTLMPNLSWHPAIISLLTRFAREEATSLVAVTVPDGTASPAAVFAGAVARPDGSFTVLDEGDREISLSLVGDDGRAVPDGGVVVARFSTPTESRAPVTHSIEALRAVERLALRDGVNVSAQRWQLVKTAAKRFLVPEA